MSGHRTTTFAAGSHVPGANLNSIQDRAHTLDLATGTAAGAPTDTLGADWITYQSPDAGIGAGTVTTIDASDRDWRERLAQVSARFVTTAARRWGRSDEHVGNDPASTNVRTALGVTGPGAVGAAAASVVDGTPPVVTTNSCPIPLDVRVDGTVWLFADPTSGALKLYNDTTTPLHVDLLVMATGRSTDPSAPPPDLVPTLTEILWLTPSLAASRPSSPGALIAIHRATDTGAVTLWDGGAWRSLGLVSVAATDVTGLPWTTAIAPDDGQTTDATTTTIATIATTTDKGHALDLVVSATQSDRSASVAFKILASVTNAAGTLTVRSQVTTPSDGASAWTAVVDVSGTNIRVRVTGAGGTTIDWVVAGTMLVHGS